MFKLIIKIQNCKLDFSKEAANPADQPAKGIRPFHRFRRGGRSGFLFPSFFTSALLRDLLILRPFRLLMKSFRRGKDLFPPVLKAVRILRIPVLLFPGPKGQAKKLKLRLHGRFPVGNAQGKNGQKPGSLKIRLKLSFKRP